ncbi:hypothetical protein [Desulfosarcina ovata]|uniref:Uncharacterized protein n=2 Tax=Desulfosarcina ovata TaxID=83564 RepID=A0A5K8AKM6_9BACT|nr:hypothetical protein [Desulfosarcina ovata]BBO86345.1 hypothetical protein DSCO28_69110 [Desulfosarcina ovata subsp. sediminis]BBO93287.1 hypothetical protein DSCOOX_64670 [Desulfosarcina ovata subsp. ovata]
MPVLTPLIDDYGRFEKQVRHFTEKLCGPFCSRCGKVCCRAHFCDETRQSPFLARVAAMFSPESTFSLTHGWLAATGCSLVAGRPPVCYEFLCHDINDALGDDPDCRHALLTLSMLMTHVGRRAIGGRHLVEATRPADLQRLRPDRFMARLDEARAALTAASEVFSGHRTAAGRQAMTRIVLPPLQRSRRRMR